MRILPSNSTKLERDLLEGGSNAIRVIDEVLPGVYLSKLVDIPDSWVPWLIQEYGLTEITQYLDDPRQVIAEGVQFVRKRGTPWAVHKGLEWVGYTDSVIEMEPLDPHWFEFQIGLDHVPSTMDELADIVGITKLAKPYTRKNSRLYSGLDIRPFVLDESITDDEGLYDDYSGVTVRPDWPRISFGKNYTWQTTWKTGHPSISIYTDNYYNFRVSYIDAFRYDLSIVDNEGFKVDADFVFATNTDYHVFGGIGSRPERNPDVVTFCKAMIVFDDQWTLDDDINSVFEMGETVEVGDPLMFDNDKIDVDGSYTYIRPVDEMFYVETIYRWPGHLYGDVWYTGTSEINYRIPRPAPLQFGLNMDNVGTMRASYPVHDGWPNLPWQNAPWAGQTTNSAFQIVTTSA